MAIKLYIWLIDVVAMKLYGLENIKKLDAKCSNFLQSVTKFLWSRTNCGYVFYSKDIHFNENTEDFAKIDGLQKKRCKDCYIKYGQRFDKVTVVIDSDI